MNSYKSWGNEFKASNHGRAAIQYFDEELDCKGKNLDELRTMVLESCYYAKKCISDQKNRESDSELFQTIRDEGRSPIKASNELINFIKRNQPKIRNNIILNAMGKMLRSGVTFKQSDYIKKTTNPFVVALESLRDALMEHEKPIEFQHWVQNGRLIYPKKLQKTPKNLKQDHLIFELAFHIRRYVSKKRQPVWNKPLPIPKNVRFTQLNIIIENFVTASLNEEITEEYIGQRITFFIRNNIKIVGDYYVLPDSWDAFNQPMGKDIHEAWRPPKEVQETQAWGKTHKQNLNVICP